MKKIDAKNPKEFSELDDKGLKYEGWRLENAGTEYFKALRRLSVKSDEKAKLWEDMKGNYIRKSEVGNLSNLIMNDRVESVEELTDDVIEYVSLSLRERYYDTFSVYDLDNYFQEVIYAQEESMSLIFRKRVKNLINNYEMEPRLALMNTIKLMAGVKEEPKQKKVVDWDNVSKMKNRLYGFGVK